MPNQIIEGVAFPFYKNLCPVNVVVTLTFVGNPVGGQTANIANGPAGSAGGDPTVLTVAPQQTVTASFDVAANGGLLYENTAALAGTLMGVTYQVEDMLWGKG